MKHAPLKPAIWPERPARLNPGEIALVILTLPEDTRRADARLLARSALQELTAHLLDLPLAKIAVIEGSHGPLLTGVASDIRISLSYAGDKVLIGLSCGRALGVDIVQVDRIAETEALSRLYLPKAACLAALEAPPGLRESNFAEAWARMEACCKVLRLPLAEIDSIRELAYANCELVDCEQLDFYRMAVAIIP
ncbi:MAG: hypothetical protein WC208_14680 [Gallionella sp.]|jgi:phosphopantetheinyl transferase